MARVTIPQRFCPQLPWYRELAGEPGYDELVRELRARQATIRSEMAALDRTGSGNPR